MKFRSPMLFDMRLRRAIKAVVREHEAYREQDGNPNDKHRLLDHFEYHFVLGLAPGAGAELLARLFLQAEQDGAERLTINLADGGLAYTVNGRDFQMAPLPTPVVLDTARELLRGCRWRNDEYQLSVRLAKEVKCLTIELKQDPIGIVTVRGFS
jgi:hypothetical protein